MKLNIIIPFKKNKYHTNFMLNFLIINLSLIFKKQNIKYFFYIVEQVDDLSFNKGLLNNIGFIYSEKKNFSKNYLFNDLTVSPKNHLIYNFNFNIEDNKVYNCYGYYHCLARFFLINEKTFRKINGYSNKYNGWGYEDTDLQKRCENKNVIIDRTIFLERNHHKKNYYFNDIIQNLDNKFHIAEVTTKKIFEKIWFDNKNMDFINKDGLSDANKYYKIVSEDIANNIIRIKVKRV